MEVLDDVKRKDMWPTATYTFRLKNIDNNILKDEITKGEPKI